MNAKRPGFPVTKSELALSLVVPSIIAMFFVFRVPPITPTGGVIEGAPRLFPSS